MRGAANLVDALAAEAGAWVRSERARFRGRSRPLSVKERATLAVHFEPDTLEEARVAETREIEDPPFLDRWRKQGVPGLLDLRQMAGIVFVDTIVVATRFPHGGARWHSLLFHEMVHVAQWRLLGPERMLRVYVEGWAAEGFEYARIPIEVQAYELQKAFDWGAPALCVESRVRERFGA